MRHNAEGRTAWKVPARRCANGKKDQTPVVGTREVEGRKDIAGEKA